MTFDQALAYLRDALKFGIHPSLDNIQALCAQLGEPQREFDVLHVGGTNGKTSTARMAAAILKQHGRSVGLYTSPHLETYAERVEIGGRRVFPGEFASAFGRVVPAAESVKKATDRQLTEFELLTAAAFVAFAKAGIDTAVLEVGLGGRWDATNICDGKVSVITSVDLDHTDRLGETVEAIAAEKAQIIKAGRTAVAGRLTPEALHVIEARAREVDAELVTYGADFGFLESDGRLRIHGTRANYREVDFPILGGHQARNAAVAVAGCEAYLDCALDQRALARALKSTSQPGRLEQLLKLPPLFIDGAHNPAAARELASWLDGHITRGRLILIVGILSDKDTEGILQALCPSAAVTICTQPDSDRAIPAVRLAAKASKLCPGEVFVHPSVAGAIESAIDAWRAGDVICVTGSLYTVGEARTALRR